MKVFPHCSALRNLLAAIALFAVLAASSHGQEAQSQTDRSRQLLRRQMEMKLEELELGTGAVEEETDLGAEVIVRRKPKPWTLTLASDVGEIWSTNVLLTDNDRQADFGITQNDSATATWRFTDELTLSGFYRYSIYRYNRLISQNFDAHNAGGSLNYQLPWEMTLSTGLQWSTIYSSPVGDSVYEEGDWNIGVNKVIPLNVAPWAKDRLAMFVGYQTDLRLASPKDYDRIEVSPYTGLYFQITPKLVAQSFYRWQYQHYQNGGRKDDNNSLNGTLTWSPLDWLSLSSFCSYAANNSANNAARDYKATSLGATLRLSWRF